MSFPTYTRGDVVLIQGDCRAVFATLAPSTFGAIVTDPPYHLTPSGSKPAGRGGKRSGFMGKKWDGGGVAFDPATWAAALELVKPGAALVAFGGPRTFHRLFVALEDGGFALVDCLAWMFGTGFPKSLNVGRMIDDAAGADRPVVGPDRWAANHPRPRNQNPTASGGGAYGHDPGTATREQTAPVTPDAKLFDGYGTGLKPAWEPIALARRANDGTFAHNAVVHGVAGFNINGTRIGNETRVVLGPREGPPSKSSYGGGLAGSRSVVGETDVGRWPTNLILDDTAAAMLDVQGDDAGLRRSDYARAATVGSMFGGPSTGGGYPGETGGLSRFFYCPKATQAERGRGNTHPTVKPLALMRWLLRLVGPPTPAPILDPFAGSGSTAVACILERRPCVLIDADPDSFAIARRRIDAALDEFQLIAPTQGKMTGCAAT